MTKRPGFTVIEFLTVCGLVSVLATLAMPALQESRESARSTQCKNNLKMLGLAMHNYHDVYNHFPPGWVLAYGDAASHSGHGWQAALLPYMDQATLFTKIDRHVPFAEPDQFTSLGVETLQCPSSSAEDINELRGGFGNSNYSGNYGSEPIPRWTSGRMESWWPGGGEVISMETMPLSLFAAKPTSPGTNAPTDQNNPSGQPRHNGLFRWNSRIGIRDITDGTSNTLMISERSVASGSGIWVGLQSNRYENDVVTDASFWSPINASFTGYSSEHSGGINALLCDGAVRFLTESIDSRAANGVFQNLADIQDGEVIPPTAWTEER